MTLKKLYITSLSIITLLLAFLFFFIGFHADTTSIAKEKLAGEIAVLEKSTVSLNERKSELEEEIQSIETDLSTKDTVNNYYMEYKKTYDELTSEIADLEAELAQLDSELAEKQLQLDTLNGVKKEKEGRKFSLDNSENYTCPDEIPEGRYRAKGNGTIVISTQTGKNLKSENLDTAYQNSYTFNIEKGQQIRVTGNVTLTTLIIEKDTD